MKIMKLEELEFTELTAEDIPATLVTSLDIPATVLMFALLELTALIFELFSLLPPSRSPVTTFPFFPFHFDRLLFGGRMFM